MKKTIDRFSAESRHHRSLRRPHFQQTDDDTFGRTSGNTCQIKFELLQLSFLSFATIRLQRQFMNGDQFQFT